jgi:hypothetical protein
VVAKKKVSKKPVSLAFDRKDMISYLKVAPRLVTFIKSNGEERKLYCTLQKNRIPKVDEDYNNLPGETVIAYDLENEAWRSFRVDSVISFV